MAIRDGITSQELGQQGVFASIGLRDLTQPLNIPQEILAKLPMQPRNIDEAPATTLAQNTHTKEQEALGLMDQDAGGSIGGIETQTGPHGASTPEEKEKKRAAAAVANATFISVFESTNSGFLSFLNNNWTPDLEAGLGGLIGILGKPDTTDEEKLEVSSILRERIREKLGKDPEFNDLPKNIQDEHIDALLEKKIAEHLEKEKGLTPEAAKELAKSWMDEIKEIRAKNPELAARVENKILSTHELGKSFVASQELFETLGSTEIRALTSLLGNSDLISNGGSGLSELQIQQQNLINNLNVQISSLEELKSENSATLSSMFDYQIEDLTKQRDKVLADFQEYTGTRHHLINTGVELNAIRASLSNTDNPVILAGEIGGTGATPNSMIFKLEPDGYQAVDPRNGTAVTLDPATDFYIIDAIKRREAEGARIGSSEEANQLIEANRNFAIAGLAESIESFEIATEINEQTSGTEQEEPAPAPNEAQLEIDRPEVKSRLAELATQPYISEEDLGHELDAMGVPKNLHSEVVQIAKNDMNVNVAPMNSTQVVENDGIGVMSAEKPPPSLSHTVNAAFANMTPKEIELAAAAPTANVNGPSEQTAELNDVAPMKMGA